MPTTAHKKVYSLTKGFRTRANNVFRVAVQAAERSLKNQYRDRRTKKRSFRTLWITRVNAAVQYYGLNYSRFINYLTKSDIALNRKMLAELAVAEPISFRAVVFYVKDRFKQEDIERTNRILEKRAKWVTRDTLTEAQQATTESIVSSLANPPGTKKE